VNEDAQRAISGLQELLSQVQGQLQNEDGLSQTDNPRGLPFPHAAHESLTLDDAENPLQLLARASDLQLSPTGVRHVQKSPLPVTEAPALFQSTILPEPSAKSFFVPARVNLDVGPDVDPVDLGVVTIDESESLFSL
jgi:hypothetical protein